MKNDSDDLRRTMIEIFDGALADAQLAHGLREELGAGEQWAERYRVERMLGEGAMARVYLALDEPSGAKVALKLMKSPPGSAGASHDRRFRREAFALSELDHPGLVRVLDSGVEHLGARRVPWLAAEYREGVTLREYVDAHGATLDWAVRTVGRCARACGHAHGRGIVHRDIKPDNVLVAPDGSEPRVIDFGLAKVLLGDESFLLSRSGALLGTPDFMAPEQFEPHDVGPPADLYSLAGVLLWLLTGEPPNVAAGANPAAWLTAACSVPSCEGIADPHLTRLLRHALAVEPSTRPADGDALAHQLDQLDLPSETTS